MSYHRVNKRDNGSTTEFHFQHLSGTLTMRVALLMTMLVSAVVLAENPRHVEDETLALALDSTGCWFDIYDIGYPNNLLQANRTRFEMEEHTNAVTS